MRSFNKLVGREKALVEAVATLLHRYSGVDGDDTDEQIDDAFDALGDALDPYVREDLGLTQETK